MIKNFCVLFLFMSGFSSLALSDADKNVTVDQAIGGMEEGSRISGPTGYSNKDIASEKHGGVANPVTDAHAHPFMQMTGNRGYMYVNAGVNGPQNVINGRGNQQTSGTALTGTNPAQAGISINGGTTGQISVPNQNNTERPTTQTTNIGSITAETGTSQTHTGSTSDTVQAVTQQSAGSANVVTQAGQAVTEHTSGPVNTGTQISQTVPGQTIGPVNVNNSEGSHGNGGILTGGETSPAASAGSTIAGTTTEAQAGSGSSGTPSNPIVGVEANTNPTSGTPNVSVHTDTGGQLEDRQVVSAGVAGAVTGSTGTQVGSASEVTGSNTVHNADVTTQPIAGTTGQTVPEQASSSVNTGETTATTVTGNGGVFAGGETFSTGHTISGAATQEPSSGTSSNPIVSVVAGTNPESGTPNAGVHTDTSGQLEDRQIVNAGVAGAATGSTGTQVGSASEITGSNAVHNADVTTQPVVGTTGQAVPEQTTGSVNTGETAVTGNGGVFAGGETSPTGQTGSGTVTQEPSSGTSSNPIIGVEANTNPTSGTPNVSVHTDTSGQLEDRQIVNAGVAGAVTGSTGAQVGSASEVTGSNTVHNADVTTQPVTGATGPTIPQETGTNINTGEAHTVGSSGTATQEPSGTSSNPIVGVQAGTNPESGTPNANVHTDTSGQLEDRQIVGAGVAGAATGSTGTQVGSASEVTGSNTVHNADVTTQPVTGTTGPTVPEQTGGSVATTGNQGYITGQAGTTEASSPTVNAPASGAQEPSGTSGASSNPIVSIEAGTNSGSGTPNAGVHTDTSGQLEDRQIINAGVAGTVTGSTGAQVGSASEVTGSNTVHNADVTTQPVTGTTGSTVPEQTSGSVNTGETTNAPVAGNGGVFAGGETSPAGSSSGPQTGTTESGTTNNNPIVTVEANTNPNSSTPAANVHTDTSGQLEDRRVIDAGVAGTGNSSSGTQVGSASNITGSETVHNTNITTQPVTAATGQTVGEQTGTTATTLALSTSTGGTQGPSSGTSSNPIVGVEVNTNPESSTPNASVHTDTSGQLEDRQIVDAGVTGQAGSTQVQEGSATDVTGQELVQEADVTTEQVPATSQTVIGQTSTGSRATTQEPSGTSGNPIVSVETGTNPEAGTPSVGVSADTTGEVEDRQILQTDLASEGVASAGQVGSASDITGSNIVHGADITTQPVSGTTGQTVPSTTEAQTGSSSSGTTAQEPSGASSNPIVAVDTNVNPSSGSPNAGVHVDTSGQLEDRQVVDAGVTGAGTGPSGTQVGSASEITGSGTVGGLDVTAQPVESVLPAPSGIGAEVDTTGQTIGAAADVGVQADVSGVSDSSDVAKKDSADGLNLGTTTHTGL